MKDCNFLSSIDATTSLYLCGLTKVSLFTCQKDVEILLSVEGGKRASAGCNWAAEKAMLLLMATTLRCLRSDGQKLALSKYEADEFNIDGRHKVLVFSPSNYHA